ncbi:MAG: hypothetical protein U5L10_05105 [Candidatus Moranbacteria bacterium]|nr:hypothetical protein [Candidatus Moranbacteria bacterium]
MIAKRYYHNPILMPSEINSWEIEATFNGCPIKEKDKIHLFYRAISSPRNVGKAKLNVSSIGHAASEDGLIYTNRRLFIEPKEEWEKYGCEDPRVTKLGDTYYIFYTALSKYPFEASGIKIGMAKTKDLENIEKFPVTTFNSKAMALFPEKIDGKYCAILSVDTDQPPASIGLVFFDREEEMHSEEFWNNWYKSADKNRLNLEMEEGDHFEVGAPPIKTEEGWLLVYSYIRNYFNSNRKTVFEIQAALLDLEDPFKVIGYTSSPLLVPEKEYELYGQIPDIVFPSGAYIENDKLHVFYGAADTVCCGAEYDLNEILQDILKVKVSIRTMKRYRGNPILEPIKQNSWEARSVFNPGAIYEEGKAHLLYRAESFNNVSVLGYASSSNGYDIDERLSEPVYTPRKDFEMNKDGKFYGCEDPRLVRIEDRIYVFYTAYNAKQPPQVAVSSIKRNDFVEKKWSWSEPKLVTCTGSSNKDASVFPEKFKGKYLFIHRINDYGMDIHYIDDIDNPQNTICAENNWVMPRPNKWDSKKVGLNGPPIKTEEGWLIFYHGSSADDMVYRMGLLLCDLKDPRNILARSEEPIFEPEEKYELEGNVPNVVFSNGHAVIKDKVFVYYGGADKVIGVATAKLDDLLRQIKRSKTE